VIRAVLFDLNNVMENYEDFERQLPDIVVRVLLRCGIFEDAKEARLAALNIRNALDCELGNGPHEHHYLFWRELITRAKRASSLVLLHEVYGEYLDEYSEHMQIYPDVTPVLTELKDRYQLAVVANGNMDRCYRFLAKYRLNRFLDAVAVSGETGSKKPEPLLFKYVLYKLGCNPDQAVMVGDRYDTDIEGAKGLGLKTVKLNRGTNEQARPLTPAQAPDYEISSLFELVDLPLLRTREDRATL